MGGGDGGRGGGSKSGAREERQERSSEKAPLSGQMEISIRRYWGR